MRNGEEIFLQTLDGAFIKSCLNFPPYWMSQVIKLNIPGGGGLTLAPPKTEREKENDRARVTPTCSTLQQSEARYVGLMGAV